jgi:uncharacterized protein (DUF2141 family)
MAFSNPFCNRTPKLLLLLFLLMSFSVQDVCGQSNQGTIICKVTAFRNSSGRVELSLYNKELNFPDLDMRWITRQADLKNSSVVEVRFENVPFGTYAVAGLHDENKSGGMDYTWLGLPKEGYCFSNDAKPFLSPPSFSEAKFKLDKPQKVVYITMQY